MIVEFKPNTFEIEDFKSFNHLFNICTYNDRYRINVDYSEINESSIFKRLDPFDQQIIIESFNAMVTQLPNSTIQSDYIISEGDERADNIYTIVEGIGFLLKEVLIILENGLNDSYFIQAIANFFDTNGTLKNALDKKWVIFENGGGCTNIPNVITTKLNEFDHLPKDPKHYLRAFVLLDSDREFPQQPIDYKHIELVTKLTDLGIPFHILEKRMMENYLPEEVIYSYEDAKNTAWVSAYRHLSNPQKDFLNLDKGFSKKDGNGNSLTQRRDLAIELQNLYVDVSDENFNRLDKGLTIGRFKATLPPNFTQSVHVYKAALEGRIKHQDDPKEFETIIRKIEKLI